MKNNLLLQEKISMRQVVNSNFLNAKSHKRMIVET